MSQEYLNYLLEKLEKKPKSQKPKDEGEKMNQFDEYLRGTEKLNANHKFIQDFVVDEKVIGRKFLNKKNEIKYLELFNNQILEFMGISKNITFIHLYDKEKNKEYDENRFIGFRYFEKDPKSLDSKYFTLIKRYDSKFYILEKNKEIKDINDNIFFDPNLDCFSIIDNIIYTKYKNKDRIINGETFPEIIGYCYGLISLGKFKKFICIEPLIPNVSNPESLKENIPDKLEENITYLEPLICDGHISLIIFTMIENLRFNIILDMSRFHTGSKHLHNSIFPKSIIIQNYRFPDKPIQRYSSCCLWFYGEIECIRNNYDYQSFTSIYNNAQDEKIKFYIDVINEIGKKYYSINNLFIVEKREKNEKVEITPKIDKDRLLINDLKHNYYIYKNIVYTQFLDINDFSYDLFHLQSYFDYKILIDSQKEIDQLFSYRNLLELNYKFNMNIDENVDSLSILECIAQNKDIVNDLIDRFKKIYDKAFLKNKLSSPKEKAFISNLSEESKKQLEILDFDVEIDKLYKACQESESNIKTNYAIFSEEEILRKLNPSNQICYKLINK